MQAAFSSIHFLFFRVCVSYASLSQFVRHRVETTLWWAISQLSEGLLYSSSGGGRSSYGWSGGYSGGGKDGSGIG